MKKILIIMTLVLVITGCGKKKDNKPVIDQISCEVTIENGESTISYSDTLTFEDKKITNISSNREISFKDSSKEDFYKEYLEKIKDNYHNVEGVESTLSGKTITIDFNVEKMSSEDINYYIEKQDEEDLIKKYDDMGYTCK